MKLLALSAAMVAAQAQTCSVPAAAAAAGYTTETLGGGVNVGSNWQPDSYLGNNPAAVQYTQNSDGSVTITGGGNGYNGQLTSTGQFGGGGYFQVTMSFTGQSYGADQPAFWANDQHMRDPVGTNWYENDIAEFDAPAPDQYGYGTVNWYGVSGSGANNRTTYAAADLPAGTNFAQPNTYGWLWVPATSTTPGYEKWYFNGQEVGQTLTWNQTGSPFSAMDGRQMTFILGTNPGNPLTVYNVQAWQNPATANDTGVGAGTTAGGCAPPTDDNTAAGLGSSPATPAELAALAEQEQQLQSLPPPAPPVPDPFPPIPNTVVAADVTPAGVSPVLAQVTAPATPLAPFVGSYNGPACPVVAQ